ncbi:MAG: 2-oxo-4-hydroxy-4-carboxy-5-ureidoimidazoline decarboxylase [Cellvibrionaceae bacterium]|nr:2-oxo-4-hydroxy-4-carboxy-5-ureidoimidazoline decarboxylase [Cellvibrionaceae bacterium]
MTLDEFNALSSSDAKHLLIQCCAAQAWVDRMIAKRPFATFDDVLLATDHIWHTLSEADFLEAFEAHPQIGNVESLRAKYASTKTLAAGEQAAVAVASEKVLRDLVDGNRVYLQKFGFIFIVFATGKSAEQMLSLLQARLPNDRYSEIKNAAEEQCKITRLRLQKLLGEIDGKEDKNI